MKETIQNVLNFLGYSLHKRRTVDALHREIEQLRATLNGESIAPQGAELPIQEQNNGDRPPLQLAATAEFAVVGLADLGLEKLIREYDFQSVIDIGAGAQVHAEVFAKFGKDVTAVDLGMSKFHLQKHRDHSDKIKEIYGNFNDLEFDRKFDCVWASHVLEHQLDAGQFLSKALSILKEGGVLAITVPPMKHEIVGGHVSLWNAGLILYRLVLAGVDCSQASILSYGYNISVIVRKRAIDLTDVSLDFDAGDIRRLKEYFPAGLTYHSNELDDPFDGDIQELNWINSTIPPVTEASHFYDLNISERQALVKQAIDSQTTLVSRWEKLASEYTDTWSLRARRAAELIGDVESVADVGCGMMTLESYLPVSVNYVPVDVVRRDDRTIVIDLNKEPMPPLGTKCIVGLGLLEYIFDVSALIKSMSTYHEMAVLSYNSLDYFPDVDERISHAWVNHYTLKQLESIFEQNGFEIAETVQHDNTQTMWRLTRKSTARNPGIAKRVVLTCDFMRTDSGKNFNQKPNLAKITDIILPALTNATTLPVTVFPSGTTDQYRSLIEAAYAAFGMSASIESWAKTYNYWSLEQFNARAGLLALLREAFEDAVVISFEASPMLGSIIEQVAIAHIDMRAHSQRFLDDLPLAFWSDSNDGRDALSEFRIPQQMIEGRVEELRARNANKEIPENSVVFMVQTCHDSSVILENGSFLEIAPYLGKIRNILRKYNAEALLIKPHPLEPQSDIVSSLLTIANSRVTHCNSYELMSSPNVAAIITFSSSTGHEAEAFGKRVHWLSLRRMITSYIPVLYQYRTTDFWRKVLASLGIPNQGAAYASDDISFEPNFLRKRFSIDWDALSTADKATERY
ncbi:hypothetical protein CAL29_29820 [Bordetella genomosp. 10]|uniref:Methyltransferase type 11 domain-containing protein n=1 Tax=Bordetella genomosp. 10 TaxID=1416804 RepID=A0A261S4G1_9BORD|nr:class I SAM-dependent methyltransferase [Bordetella genomosp. 10]OZI32035.1 hypothetical protein CAL29_29820 [Bordetella genomosp. 10]